MSASTLETIDHSLDTVTGGDAWDSYKAQMNTNARDTVSRAQATVSDVKQGNWSNAVDNGLGTVFNGLAAFRDGVSGWNPIPWK